MQLIRKAFNIVVFIQIMFTMLFFFENYESGLDNIVVQVELWEVEYSFELSSTTFITTFAIAATIMIVIGINAIGSGLNDRSTGIFSKTIALVVIYIILWLFSSQYINRIPIYNNAIQIIFMLIYMMYFFVTVSEVE